MTGPGVKAPIGLMVPDEALLLTDFRSAPLRASVDAWLVRRPDLAPWAEDLITLLGVEADRLGARDGVRALVAVAEPVQQWLVSGTADILVTANPFLDPTDAVTDDPVLIAAEALRSLTAGLADIDAVEVDVLPVGPPGGPSVDAVRARRLDLVHMAHDPHDPQGPQLGERVGVDRVQYFLPNRDVLAVLDFSTPFLRFGDELAEWWDTVARSFRWLPSGAPPPVGWIGLDAAGTTGVMP